MENYLVTVMALQKLIQNERNLMVGIIPLQHQSKIFEIIIKSSMDMIVQDGEVSFCNFQSFQMKTKNFFFTKQFF